jgi:hypothetical protein
VKKLIILVSLLTLAVAPAATAQQGNGNGNGPPTHGCDQALENDGDAYDSTCDGSPSENGNGNGGGKPCAGCVGAADNKNPPGQAPDGSDHNNGYECDGNNGIGKGNPAHSACEPYSGIAPRTKTKKIHGSNARAVDAPLDDESNVTGATLLVAGLAGIALLIGVRMVVHRRVTGTGSNRDL